MAVGLQPTGLTRGGRSSAFGIGPSKAEPFWSAFLKSLAQRGLKGVKLVISDAHEGLKAAVAKVLLASRQRCRVPGGARAVAASGRDSGLPIRLD
jgi:putative transposase